jgi:hypothetical protein
MDRTCALRVKQMTLTNLDDLSFAPRAFRFCFACVSPEKLAKIVTLLPQARDGFRVDVRVDALPIEEWIIRQNALESQRS